MTEVAIIDPAAGCIIVDIYPSAAVYRFDIHLQILSNGIIGDCRIIVESRISKARTACKTCCKLGPLCRRHSRDGCFVNVLKYKRIIKCNSISLGEQLNLSRCGERKPIAIQASVAPVPPVLVINIAASTVNIDPAATHLHIYAHITGHIIPSGGASVE
ncbi:hypothetical protein D3C78_1099920 [compost metagenome]